MEGNSAVGAGSGAISPVLAVILGVINVENIIETALLACVGAGVGFLTTLLLKKFLKAIKIKID